MTQTTKILLIDDDVNISKLVRLYLEKEGFTVITSYRGDEGVEQVERENPSLILLDIMLPGLDGWEVCRKVRENSKIPIIMLSAKDETFDKILGLELGADDYVAKPFEPKELVARVKAVLRRCDKPEETQEVLRFQELSVSLARYEVLYRGQKLELPPKELETLYFLASHPNKVFTREQLLEQVWGFEFFGDSRTVDVHIKRLREKLTDCEQYGWGIHTVWGVGYKFEVQK